MFPETIVRDMGHHTPSYSGPQEAEPQGWYQWTLLPSGFQWDSANERLQPKEGSEGRKGVRLGKYSPSFILAESLGLATYLSQNMQILPGGPLHIALNTRFVPSPISSILWVEMDPSASNSVIVSLNPANTLINNPFNKLSSSYPV